MPCPEFVYAASPAPSSEGVSDLVSSVARGTLHPYEQRGACTIKPGCRVLKDGVEYRVICVTRDGVVALGHISRGFAMYTHGSLCVEIA